MYGLHPTGRNAFAKLRLEVLFGFAIGQYWQPISKSERLFQCLIENEGVTITARQNKTNLELFKESVCGLLSEPTYYVYIGFFWSVTLIQYLPLYERQQIINKQ